MKKTLICALLAITIGIAGCSREDHKTIEWYDQHPEARADKLKWCAVDATRVTDPDCMNANKSQQVQNVTNGKRTFGPDYKFK